MKNRRLLDAALVAAMLIAYVPGAADALQEDATKTAVITVDEHAIIAHTNDENPAERLE